MKYSKLLRNVLVVFLFLVFVLGSFRLLLYDSAFYEGEFVKNGVYDEFGEENTLNYRDNLFGYFQGKEQLNPEYFNDKEIKHLEDVKNIFNVMNYVLYASLLIVVLGLGGLIYKKKKKLVGEIFFYSGVLSFVLLVVLFIGSFLSFDYMFTLMHETLFTNDLWLMDPSTDNLISIFPFQFFYDFFVRVLIYFLGMGVGSLVLGWYLKK